MAKGTKGTSTPLRTVSSQQGAGARAASPVRNKGRSTGGNGAIVLPGASKNAGQSKTGR
jgi:hypothetical protein